MAGLQDLSSEGPKAPCCALDPSDVVWPILAVPDSGKSVTCSGLVTSLPKPYPSLHPPCPDMKQDYGGEKVPEAPPAQTNCSRESLSCSVCLFYKLSSTDPSRGRLNFLFFLNIYIFFFLTCYFRGSLQRENKQQGGWEPPGSSVAVFPADERLCVLPGGKMGARQGWRWLGRAAKLVVVTPKQGKDGSPFPVGTARRDHTGSEVAGLRPRGCHHYWSLVEGDNPRQ